MIWEIYHQFLEYPETWTLPNIVEYLNEYDNHPSITKMGIIR